jgi:dUTP pyrophosphatase
MILPGKTAIARGVICGLRNFNAQTQPCGVDLSLRDIQTWTASATLAFSNEHRVAAETQTLAFTGGPKQIHLAAGHYLVMFNENVEMPLDIMGQIFVRSSLWRSGVLLSAGVMDSGYKGAVGALMQVVNAHGVTLHQNARLAQMVFHEMTEEVAGYIGVYQGATGLSAPSGGGDGP